jgi:hypothetical protein
MDELIEAHVDITMPADHVEIKTSQDKSVVWINVDGVCVLRVCRIPKLAPDIGSRT